MRFKPFLVVALFLPPSRNYAIAGRYTQHLITIISAKIPNQPNAYKTLSLRAKLVWDDGTTEQTVQAISGVKGQHRMMSLTV